jgi:hypothetical protein
VFLGLHDDRMCLRESLVAARNLVPKDAPPEYASSSTLVELALDEDLHICSPCDASSLGLVGGQLPFNKQLKDWGPLVGIFEIQLRWLIDCHDFGFFDLRIEGAC